MEEFHESSVVLPLGKYHSTSTIASSRLRPVRLMLKALPPQQNPCRRRARHGQIPLIEFRRRDTASGATAAGRSSRTEARFAEIFAKLFKWSRTCAYWVIGSLPEEINKAEDGGQGQ